ncbi:immunoglobulin kappa light chain-like isoform X2 [Nelusetta ayraudi]|uniref:immunoglobulin kappa light chain-like isoform X2 n=1 Tax=Nelusetta ayraudi TaxID=303726 RepID=UPI003F6E990C
MTPLTFVLRTFCFIFLVVENSTIKSSTLHVQLANVGEDVTLSCSCHSYPAVEYYWYKQRVGPSPQLVTKCFRMNDKGTFGEEFNNPRFSLDVKQSNPQLKISNLKISDSATYYCLAVKMRTSEFCEGTTLTVKGSAFSISTSVYESKAIQSGEPETLNCTMENLTCSGEHSVYWFRDSGGSHPGLIYTQGGSNDQCLGEPKTQTPTCEFNLTMDSWNLSHAGTYYCAVVACGHITFGENTRIYIKNNRDILFLVYTLAAGLTFTSMVIVWLTFSLYKTKRNFPSESLAGHSAMSPENTMGLQDAGAIYHEPSNVNVPSRSEDGSNQENAFVYNLVNL